MRLKFPMEKGFVVIAFICMFLDLFLQEEAEEREGESLDTREDSIQRAESNGETKES